MKKIDRNEVLGLGDYETVRSHFRTRVIEEKKRRRLAVGAFATVVFENRDTVLLQIQEMLRTERITKESAIRHEIETYNALIPGPHEVSATLMIEIDERAARERFLTAGAGLERSIFLDTSGKRFPARVDGTRVHAGRTTAVHYLIFPGVEAVSDGTAFVIDHPALRVRAELPRALLEVLEEELAEG